MEVIRHYPMPTDSTCGNCAGQCEAGKPCPREPIPTDFGDIEDGDRSTQAGAMFAVALVAVIACACFALWVAGQKGMLS
jgi:hypothetical protein